MRVLKKLSSGIVMVLLTSSLDHVSGADELDLAVSISKNGGDFEAITPSISGKSNGWYKITLSSSDTDTIGDLVLHISATGADPTDVIMNVAEFSMDEIGLMVNEFHTLEGLKEIESTTDEINRTWTAGDITIQMTGDGVDLRTMKRVY